MKVVIYLCHRGVPYSIEVDCKDIQTIEASKFIKRINAFIDEVYGFKEGGDKDAKSQE